MSHNHSKYAANDSTREPVAPPTDPYERDRWLLLCLFRGLDESCFATRLGRFL